MKVIKKNNFLEGIFPMQIKCQRIVDEYGFAYGEEKDFCGSELEIEVADIRKFEWFKYPYHYGCDYVVVCPVCGKFIVVDTNKIPKNVLDEVEYIK